MIPMSGSLGREFEPDADDRPDTEHFRTGNDQLQLGRVFHHKDTLDPHLAGIEAQIDKLFVLVAVADQIGNGILHIGQCRDQLRFAARFQPMVVERTEFRDFLQHLLLLVHLDRIDAAIVALIVEFLDGAPKALVQLLDARIKNIRKAQQDGHVHSSVGQAIDNLAQAHANAVSVRMHDHLALLRHAEIIRAPVVDAVDVRRILDRPSCFFRVQASRYRHVVGILKVFSFPIVGGIGFKCANWRFLGFAFWRRLVDILAHYLEIFR